MFNIDPLYIFINILLLLTFISMGRFAAKGGNYKFSSGVCIVAFTLVLGSRYMRGNDYGHYIEVFNRRTEADQHLFTLLNDFLSAIDINAYGAFFVYALIFSSCLFYLLRRYKPYSAYSFPLALIALIIFHESMIRQALSFSFIFLLMDKLFGTETIKYQSDIGVRENEVCIKSENNTTEYEPTDCNTLSLNEEDYYPLEEPIFSPDGLLNRITWRDICICAILITCAISIHTANSITIVAIMAFWIIMRNKTIPFYMSIPLMLFGALILNNVLNLDSIAPYVNLLQGTDKKFDTYIENSDYWFGEEGASSTYTRKGIILYCELWGYGTLFWLADRMSKQMNFGRIFASMLNTLIVGTFVMMTFRELEILHRIGHVLTLFWFIPLSICLYHIRDFELRTWEKVLLCGSTWWVYEYLKYLFMRASGMTLFLWDAPNIHI